MSLVPRTPANSQGTPPYGGTSQGMTPEDSQGFQPEDGQGFQPEEDPFVWWDVTDDPTSEDIEELTSKLVASNKAAAPDEKHLPLGIFMRDEDGILLAGLSGYTHWGWLYVSKLWVEDRHRHTELGRTLLHTAEDEARRRGCHSSWLNTFSFQAKPFYEHLGYTEFGKLTEYPQGFSFHFLHKKL